MTTEHKAVKQGIYSSSLGQDREALQWNLQRL